jgi:hypothetical protein
MAEFVIAEENSIVSGFVRPEDDLFDLSKFGIREHIGRKHENTLFENFTCGKDPADQQAGNHCSFHIFPSVIKNEGCGNKP